MSTVTHFNPDSIYGFDSASTGSVLTKGSSSSITFQNISTIVPSNVSSFTNDAGYINSGVTAMTNYATSASVVNAINNIDSVVILDGNRWANTALTPAMKYVNMPPISSIKSVISDGKTPIIRFRDLKLINGVESVYSADSVSYLMLVDYTEDNNHIIFNGVDEYNRLITLNGSRPYSSDDWSYKTTELNNMAYGLFANMYMSNGVTKCNRSIAEIIAAYNANLPIDIRYAFFNLRSYNIEVSNNVVTVHFVDEPELPNNEIRDGDYPVITGIAQSYGDEWGNFTPFIPRRGLKITDLADVNFSSITINNPNVLAYDTTTSSVTRGTVLIPQPSSNLSDYINDAGFITSGATAMTHYATSANVVNAINAKSDVFVCTFTGSNVNNLTCNKTVSEIYNAKTAGKEVIGLYNGYVFRLIQCDNSNGDNVHFSAPCYIDMTLYNQPESSSITIMDIWRDTAINNNWHHSQTTYSQTTLLHNNKVILDKIPSSLGTSGQVLTINSGANGFEFTSISNSVTNLSDLVNDTGFITSASLTSFSASVVDNEEIIAQALTDLDSRKLGDLYDVTTSAAVINSTLLFNGSGWVTGYISADTAPEHIYYSTLKDLVDNSSLTPGKLYRIIDYATTTTQSGTSAAFHRFDLIVLATSENALDSRAMAVYNIDDPYFYDNGCDLSKWQIWYDVNNDTSKYYWADSANGTGVIYRMIDEWGNDCPYDFKNIMFERDHDGSGGYEPSGSTDFFYTFSWFSWNSPTGEEITDLSIFGNYLHDYMDAYEGVYGNVISPVNVYDRDLFIPSTYSGQTMFRLPNNVFMCSDEYQHNDFRGVHSNFIGYNSYCNTFNGVARNNKLGEYCCNNDFFGPTYNSTIDDMVYNNAFAYLDTVNIHKEVNHFDYTYDDLFSADVARRRTYSGGTKIYNVGNFVDGYEAVSFVRLPGNICRVDFPQTKSTSFVTISADTDFILNFENSDDNILWVENTNRNGDDILFSISAITWNGMTPSSYILPEEPLKILQDHAAEIGIIVNQDMACITWRSDLIKKNSI